MDIRRQKKNKSSPQAKKIKVAVILIFLLLFFLGGVRNVYNQWANAWDQQTSANILLIGDKGYLLTIFPKEKRVISWSFPDNWYLDTFGGYGRFSISGVAKFARNEERTDILSNSVMMDLQLPIDYILQLGKGRSCVTGKIKDCAVSALWYQGVLNRGEVNKGSKADFLKMALTLRQGSFAWEEKDAKKEGLLVFDTTLDEKDIYLTVNQKIDDLAVSYFIDPDIRKEGLNLGIYNYSNQQGLGSNLGKVWEHSGALVVEVKSSVKNEPLESCSIEIKDKSILQSKTFLRISQNLSCPVKIGIGDFSVTDINIHVGPSWVN
jgi:hypothetical protein